MKHEILITSYKTNLSIKFDNDSFPVMISPKLGLVPVGTDLRTLKRFLAIWKRTEDIIINTNIKNINIFQIVSNCRKYLDFYNSFHANLHNVGNLFDYNVAFVMKKTVKKSFH